jgi:hypothetical protein
MEEAAGWALRLVGAFYALAAVFALRRCAMDLLLTRALAALRASDSKETRAENGRIALQVLQLLLVGFGGIALMPLLSLALPIFIASAGLHALNVFVLAPRIFDPLDPPDAAGLAQRRRSMLVYLMATLLIAAAEFAGVLRDWRAEAWPVLALAALLGLGLMGYAFRLLRGMPRAPAWATDTAPLGPLPADEPPQPEPGYDEALRNASFILSPSWDEGALFEAKTCRPVFLTLPRDMLTEADWDAIQFLLDVWRDVGDPADPQRCRFSAPDGAARIATEGEWVFQQLAARLAPRPIRFEPTPWPRLSLHDATAVRLMSELGAGPLWVTNETGHEPVNPQDFGISWRLALDIHIWGLDFDEGIGWDDPGGPPLWTEAEAAAHEAEGLLIAQRLARELAATGRGHVPLGFWSESETRLIPIQGA